MTATEPNFNFRRALRANRLQEEMGMDLLDMPEEIIRLRAEVAAFTEAVVSVGDAGEELHMDIGSGNRYPSNALSNFAPHAFVFDDVPCASMEGLLQSFKQANPDVQREMCQLVGYAAKKKGRPLRWQRTQTLYWQGTAYPRDSQAYQDLLDRAYDALATNAKFRAALLATGTATLMHTIGRTNEHETVLTRREFCSRLTAIRARLRQDISRQLLEERRHDG